MKEATTTFYEQVFVKAFYKEARIHNHLTTFNYRLQSTPSGPRSEAHHRVARVRLRRLTTFYPLVT